MLRLRSGRGGSSACDHLHYMYLLVTLCLGGGIERIQVIQEGIVTIENHGCMLSSARYVSTLIEAIGD